mmetsp:Transcript_20680/g.18329  ORF Transcript_20680/g.18329 Transcript_20680/m.18329 type:complete len:207 (+) Transcript_20680:392-1012(+)
MFKVLNIQTYSQVDPPFEAKTQRPKKCNKYRKKFKSKGKILLKRKNKKPFVSKFFKSASKPEFKPVETFYSTIKTNNPRFRKFTKSTLPDSLKNIRAKINNNTKLFENRINDREVYKLMLGNDKDIHLSSTKSIKSIKIENIHHTKPSRRHSQGSINRKWSNGILNPNLGLREIILDPNRHNRLEPKTHNISKRDKMLSQIDLIKY